jgi:GNAT superfamily N-acetyltransferase
MEWSKGYYSISNNKALIDMDIVYRLLSGTYWAANRTKETIEKSLENSIIFGVYDNKKQIGFARVLTDTVVFSWLLDVVIDEQYQSNGLGKWLLECIIEHPEIKDTKIGLETQDAHKFYEQFNFKISDCMRRTKPK